jgi:hypothetical protein
MDRFRERRPVDPDPKSGKQLMRGLKRAVQSEGIGRTAVRLAWTAGPVTYLALQGGYYIAYQQPVPTPIFFYFAGYTVVAGLAAVLVRIVYRATRGERIEQDQRALDRSLGVLPGLVLHARDHALAGYDEESARMIAARYLLQNPDATELAVSSAIRDLGGSRDLAYSFQRIEVFRRNGMYSRVKVESQSIERDVEALTAQLIERSPITAQLVADRAAGLPPRKASGRRRVEGFLERALAADSIDDSTLLTLADIEEILGLAIEILSGRSFPLVLFHFEGDNRPRAAWNELERARREYRTRLRARNSRLRLVAEILSKRLPDYLPGTPRLTAVPQLISAVSAALESWAGSLNGLRFRFTRDTDIETIRKAISAYSQLEEADRQLSRCHKRLVSTARAYQDLIHLSSSREKHDSQVQQWIGAQFRMEQKEISLQESQRLMFARKTDETIADLGPARTADELRSAAVDIIGHLEAFIPLYRTEVQQAIELSRAPTFSSIEAGLSRKVLVDWVTALVAEVDGSPQEYYVGRIMQLTRYHGVVLDDRSRPAIARQLNIDPALLITESTVGEANETPWAQPLARVPELSASLTEAVRKRERRSRERPANGQTP